LQLQRLADRDRTNYRPVADQVRHTDGTFDSCLLAEHQC
jgi:hypothetical protein